MRLIFDKDICIVTLFAALTIASASILVPSTRAQTGSPAPAVTTPSDAAKTMSVPGAEIGSPTDGTAPVSDASVSAMAEDDGDDDLAEPWTEPKYSHEQRVQLAGMIVMFLLTAVVGFRRKQSIRRLARG